MEMEDEVREVKVHSISLRRPRSRKRGTTPPSLSADWTARMLGSLRGGLTKAIEPPQQSWLALLGLSSFAVKGTSYAWRALVTEGSHVQVELGRQIAHAAERLRIPGTRRARMARP